MPTITHEDGFTVEVTQEQMDRWEHAERRRDEALAVVEAQYAEATADRRAVLDAAEAAYYASLPPLDPDNPPGPVRDLFPRATTTAKGLFR